MSKHTLAGEPQDGGESLESFHSRFYELRLPDDIKFVKQLLRRDYSVTEGEKKGSIRCVSYVGIEDEEMWEYVFKAIKQRFDNRFQEVYHNVCYNHKDFIIYFKPEPQ